MKEPDPDSSRPDPDRRRGRPGGGRVVPAWVIVPVAGFAGFFTSQWPGLIFGLAIGVFLWRVRR